MSNIAMAMAMKAQKDAKKLTAPKNILDYNLGTNTLSVYSKYGKGKDIMFRFMKLTVNQLFGLYRVFTYPNTSPVPTTFSYVDPLVVPIAPGQTDWISPYVIRATQNGDGSPEQFTGGAHSSDNNSTTGYPTAVTSGFYIYADGKRISGTTNVKCDKVDIYVKNRIMAYNTKTLTRYTHEEYVHYTIQGSKIDVNVRIVPLEQLAWKTYYSLEAVVTYYTHAFYPLGQYSTEQVIYKVSDGSILPTDSGAKQNNFVDTVILSKGGSTDYLEVHIDNYVGLGKRDLVDSTVPLTFTTSVGKVYNKLVGDTEKIINLGEVYEWRGYYKFYNLD